MARLLPKRIKRFLIAVLEEREEADVFTTYYRANSRRRLTSIAGRSGLRVLDLRMVLSSAEFAVVTPVAILELLWIRALMTHYLRAFRPTIIGIFSKP